MITDLTSTNDVERALEHIRNKYPQARIYALGYSMGSNLLLRYLKNNQMSLSAAVAISTPWNIEELAKLIRKPTKRIYDYGISRNFKRNLKRNLKIMREAEQTFHLEIGH
jgi:hypothetical protein